MFLIELVEASCTDTVNFVLPVFVGPLNIIYIITLYNTHSNSMVGWSITSPPGIRFLEALHRPDTLLFDGLIS